MTTVGKNRGSQPLHSTFAMPIQSRPAMPTQFSGNPVSAVSLPLLRAAEQEARNSLSLGSRLLNKFQDFNTPIFQTIAEVYIAGFVALDLVGMVLTRSIGAIIFGRDKYDPSKDPTMKDKPFDEQVRAWIHRNFKGLNWKNFQEEVSRELATIPGALFLASLIYVVASRTVSRDGIHMKKSALDELSAGFREHLESSSLKAAGANLSLEEYRQELGKYFASIFKDQEMRQTKISPDMEKYIASLFKDGEMPKIGPNTTIGELLDELTQRWAKAMSMESGKAAYKTQDKALRLLSDQLKGILMEFNREHRLKAYTVHHAVTGEQASTKATDSLLHRIDHIWATYRRNGQWVIDEATGRAGPVEIDQLLSDLRKFTDVARGTYKAHTGKLAGLARNTLPEVVESIRQRTVSNKMLFVGSVMLLGTAYLAQLVFWTQRNKSYQATRLLHADSGTSATTPNPTPPVVSQVSGYPPVNFQQQAFFPYAQRPLPPLNPPMFNSPPPGSIPGRWFA